MGRMPISAFRVKNQGQTEDSQCRRRVRFRAARWSVLLAGMSAGAQGSTMIQPLHFFVEDALIQAIPLAQWNDRLLRMVARADQLLCYEMNRAEKARGCDLRIGEGVKVTPFDRSLEDGLRRTWSEGKTAPGALNQDGLNFLFDQTDPSERRIFVVRRLLSCDGNRVEALACTRFFEPATVLAFDGQLFPIDNAVTLLHELGHQVGLKDVPDPHSLMYRGRPVPRAGTKMNAAEAAAFRKLLTLSW